MKKSQYRPDIDGLRAVAVISVLLFHLGFETFSGGYVGVDVFFVISGFLITRIIRDEVLSTGAFSFSNFYLRRARRLFPALYFTLSLSFISAFLLFSPQHFQRFGGALVSSILSVSNFYFWGEAGYFDTEADYKPLLHTWSLGVEEQFYLVWPVVLVFLLLKTPRRTGPIVLVVGGIISLILNFIFSDGDARIIKWLPPTLSAWFEDGASTIFFLAPFRVFEFAIGGSIVWLIRYQFRKQLLSEIMVILGLGMIAYPVFTYTENTLFPSYNALLPCVGTAFILFAGTAQFTGRLLRNRFAVGIGLISYSLYLVHWPTIVFYKYWKLDDLSLVEQLTIATLSIIAASLMYRFVEQPFRNKANYVRQLPPARFALASAFLSLAIALPAVNAWATRGWDWRVPELAPEIQAQVSNSRQFHKDNYGGQGYPYSGWIKGESPADIVLVGDSHARHYAYGIDKVLAEKRGLSVYAISGTSCLHLPGFSRTTKGTNWDIVCPENHKNALRAISKSPTTTVIMSHSWVSQRKRAALLKNGKRSDDIVSTEDVIQALSKFKQQIGDRTLIVIGNVPTTGGSAPLELLTRPVYVPPNNRSNPFYKPRMNDDLEQFNKELQRYADETGSFVFLDPFDALCDAKKCRNIDKSNRLIYSDRGHLSKAGSEYVMEFFLAKINSVIPAANQ